MPWLAETVVAAAVGVTGTMNWWGPTQIGASRFHSMAIPTGVSRVDAKGSYAIGRRHCYMVGNWSENMVMTDDYQFWPQGIPAATVVPTVSLSGTGLTGEMICYLAYYDEDSDLWSPLSAPSATLSAVNNGVLWGSLPTSPSGRVTHIAGWRSVDGGLPRLAWIRQVGVTSVTDTTALGDLGQAWVDDFGMFARGKFNVIWHERQVVAGDDDNPDTLYLSLIGDYEKYSNFTLKTKSGRPIVGLLEVGGTLIVLCNGAIEVVTGWTEDDLAIEIAQHGFGGLNHHAATKFHNFAMVWSPLGPYLTDGSGWWPMYKDIKTKWAHQYESFRDVYDQAWAEHDPVTGVVMLHVGYHSDVYDTTEIPQLATHWDTFWVASYAEVIPDVGGGYAQPDWSYDAASFSFDSARALSVPGGVRADLYYGACNGKIYRADPNGTQAGDGGTPVSPGVAIIRSGARFFADDGGDIAQGKKFVWVDMFVQSEDDSWVLNLYGGDEYAFPAITPSFTNTVPASVVFDDTDQDAVITFQPKTTHPFNLSANRVIGRAIVVEVRLTSGEYRGEQIYWTEGETQRVAGSVFLSG